METTGKRIAEKREARGLNKSQLAKLVGVSGATMTDWENGNIAPENIKSEKFLLLAKHLGTTPDYLMWGKADKDIVFDSNVSDAPETRGLLPLISWVQAGDWHPATDHLSPGEAEEWLPCPASHGANAYALLVKGESMTAPHGKSYPDGCIIYVDPDQTAVTGDRVIAKINGDDEVTFKQLVIDSGRPFLKPLNPQYPLITDKFRVLGKVIAKYEPE